MPTDRGEILLPKKFLAGRVVVKVGDITMEATDVIVNAANSTLLGGGGVDGAIHRKGGPAILEACKKIRKESFPKGLPTGDAVATTAGALAAKFVIHTVGPVWAGGDKGEEKLLGSCYRRSLEVARELNVKTLAFPAISTGVYRFPKEQAARIASEAIQAFLENAPQMTEVRLVFFSDEDAKIFLSHQLFRA